jgi:hypothetical protein
MKRVAFLLSIAVYALADLLAMWALIGLWTEPPDWGWSAPLRIKALILTAAIASLTALFIVLIRAQRIGARLKILWIISISLATFAVTLGIVSYAPRRPSLEETLAGLGLSPSAYSALDACEKVAMFAEAGYRHMDLHHRGVAVPSWMHQSLREMPMDTLIGCLASEISKQLEAVQGDSQQRENATQKVYALIFETQNLGADRGTDFLGAPELLALENIAVCLKDMDPYGDLALPFYAARFGNVPDYDYFSAEGVRRLHADLCGK